MKGIYGQIRTVNQKNYNQNQIHQKILSRDKELNDIYKKLRAWIGT